MPLKDYINDREIAKHAGCSISYAARLRRKDGGLSAYQSAMLDALKLIARSDYGDEYMSDREIARRFDVSPTTVGRWRARCADWLQENGPALAKQAKPSRKTGATR